MNDFSVMEDPVVRGATDNIWGASRGGGTNGFGQTFIRAGTAAGPVHINHNAVT
jgi:hypothetical protein